MKNWNHETATSCLMVACFPSLLMCHAFCSYFRNSIEWCWTRRLISFIIHPFQAPKAAAARTSPSLPCQRTCNRGQVATLISFLVLPLLLRLLRLCSLLLLELHFGYTWTSAQNNFLCWSERSKWRAVLQVQFLAVVMFSLIGLLHWLQCTYYGVSSTMTGVHPSGRCTGSFAC